MSTVLEDWQCTLTFCGLSPAAILQEGLKSTVGVVEYPDFKSPQLQNGNYTKLTQRG